MKTHKLASLFRVEPGESVLLAKRKTDWAGTPEMAQLTKDQMKATAKAFLDESIAELSRAQELLWAQDTHAVLVIFQAMDAAGKDGTIKHVMSGVNPQGCRVYSFKRPSTEELDHTFLWRHMKALPERGQIVIFNRSHYEDVLIVKVHPELLELAKLPVGKRGKSFWNARYEDINNFEEHLTRNGTLILKFFLHVSKDEQKQRFLERLEDPKKYWKFSPADLNERDSWEDYQRAYEDMLNATSTKAAPWYVIPADNKWVTRALVAIIMTSSIRSLDLTFPRPTREQLQAIEAARLKLANE